MKEKIDYKKEFEKCKGRLKKAEHRIMTTKKSFRNCTKRPRKAEYTIMKLKKTIKELKKV